MISKITENNGFFIVIHKNIAQIASIKNILSTKVGLISHFLNEIIAINKHKIHTKKVFTTQIHHHFKNEIIQITIEIIHQINQENICGLVIHLKMLLK